MYRHATPDTSNPATRVAVILTAGLGRRLGPELTDGGPKCLVRMAGRSLLSYQVEALARAGVGQVVLVVGHAEERVRAEALALGARFGVAFSFVRNERYADTNTLYSQYLARAHIAAGCFCLNSDVLFPPSVLSRLADSAEEAALAVDVRRCGDEEVKVTVDPTGRVREIGKGLDPGASLGEFIGVARYRPGAGAAFAAALADAVEEGRTGDYYEHALGRIAHRVRLGALPLRGEPVIEIDFPEDYTRAVTEILPRIESARTPVRAAELGGGR